MRNSLSWWLAGCLALAAVGCSSDGGQSSPLTGASNTASSGVLVQVSPGLLKGEEPETPPPPVTISVNVLSPEGTELVPTQRVLSTGLSNGIFVPGVPAGPVRVLVRVEGQDEELLSTREEVAQVAAQGITTVVINSLTPAGATREIGLVSVGANGTQGSGTSNSPSLSFDGRFVAFESRANLLPGNPDPGSSEIFVRDRLFLTLRRASLNESGEVITADCFEPDISGDGRYVVFRRGGTTQGPIQVRDRGFGSEPAQTFSFSPGSRPKISGDGRFIVFQNNAAGLQQIFLRRTTTNAQELVSRTPSGAPSNGFSSSPCISQEGRFVAFHSTATDLLPGGSAGVYLRDRIDQSLVQLPIASNLTDVCLSSDGRFVLASAPGQIPFLFDRQSNTGIALSLVGSGLIGRPSLSGDGQKIAFFSSNTGLIDKDINGQPDVFVLDRASDTISRVNVSNDGTAVLGGVDQTAPGRGPVLSALGNRVAFAAADRDLVPNGRSQLDVYSATAPTPGKLYAILAGSIFRYEGANTASGLLTPTAKLSSRDMVSPRALFLDVTNDRLYVLTNGDEFNDPEIAVLNQISTKTNGTPDRRIRLGTDFRGDDLALDITRNTLYVLDREEVLALANASNLNGQVPASGQRRFHVANSTGSLRRLLLDTRLDEVYFGVADQSLGPTLSVVAGSTSSGVAQLKRRLFGPTIRFQALAMDTSPRSFGGGPGNDSSLLLMDEKNQASTFLSNGSRSGFLGSATPQLVIPGSDERIIVNAGTPKEFAIFAGAGVYFDSNTNLRYVGDQVRAEVQVFRSSGGATPVRVMRLLNAGNGEGGTPRDITVDRTR